MKNIYYGSDPVMNPKFHRMERDFAGYKVTSLVNKDEVEKDSEIVYLVLKQIADQGFGLSIGETSQ